MALIPNLDNNTLGIPELDSFLRAETRLIRGETNPEDQLRLWRLLYKGMRTILSAQLQMPPTEDADYAERTERKIRVIKEYLESQPDA